MRRKKITSGPSWLIWEGDDFPRSIHSDSVVFYTTEHLYLDIDPLARRQLASQIQREGISDSLSESFKLIENSSILIAGMYYEDADTVFPTYCTLEDENIELDVTFVEVPVVL